ncbi:hypothetical protein VaNZ11_012067, partial [Volvox africanus]
MCPRNKAKYTDAICRRLTHVYPDLSVSGIDEWRITSMWQLWAKVKGAYGFVWKCLERATGRHVAIKGFKQAHEEPEIMRLAVREARVLQTLKHPAIIQLLEAFKSKSGRVYMVFPYGGLSAYQELEKHPDGFPDAQLKLLVWQLLQALVYLHRRKVVHRDIKPGNILVSEHGELKLCDFGFARTTNSGPRGVERLT